MVMKWDKSSWVAESNTRHIASERCVCNCPSNANWLTNCLEIISLWNPTWRYSISCSDRRHHCFKTCNQSSKLPTFARKFFSWGISKESLAVIIGTEATNYFYAWMTRVSNWVSTNWHLIMWALIGTLKPLKYLKNGESFKWNKTENQFDNIILSINASNWKWSLYFNVFGTLNYTPSNVFFDVSKHYRINFKATEVTKVIRNF